MDKDDLRPEFVLGLVFPDFLRNSKAGLRLKKNNLKKPVPNEFKNLHDGIKKHYLVDQIFHNSAYFKENTRYIQNELKNRNFKDISKRRFFLAHIMLELIIDRVLLDEDILLGNQFYKLLNKTDLDVVYNYLVYNELSEEFDGFKSYFDHFIKSQYLFSYQRNSSLSNALINVYFRALILENSKTDLDELSRTIASILPRIQANYQNIFKEIKQQVL